MFLILLLFPVFFFSLYSYHIAVGSVFGGWLCIYTCLKTSDAGSFIASLKVGYKLRPSTGK
jgi:hypothetical protein